MKSSGLLFALLLVSNGCVFAADPVSPSAPGFPEHGRRFPLVISLLE